MIIDSSALVAFVLDEPEAEAIRSTLAAHGGATMCVANYLESQIGLRRKRPAAAGGPLRRLMAELRIELAGVDEPLIEIAVAADRRYGRGTNHPAKLNFGDCFAYALGRSSGEPLLFIGEDFTHTDIEPALAQP